MGNKRNRAKRNKRQAANWRGIIKMRKQEKGKSRQEVDEQAVSKIGNEPSEHRLEFSEDTNTENSENLLPVYDNSNESNPQQFSEEDGIRLGDKKNQMQCTIEHNYCVPLHGQKDYHTHANQDSTNCANLNTFEEMTEDENMLTTQTCSTFNFDDWIEVDDDYNELEQRGICIMNEDKDRTRKCTEILEDQVHINAANIVEEDASSFDSGRLIENDESDEGECESCNGSVRGDANSEPTDRNEGLLDNDNAMTEDEMNDSATNNAINVTGRRIVDMNFLFNQIKHLNSHSDDDNCNFNDMDIVKQTKMGLRTIFAFRCRVCGIEKKVSTCERDMHGLNVNKAAVLGITSIGSGFYNLEEFCAHLDIPCMSDKTFQENNKNLQTDWWQLAQQCANEALNEEIKLAKATGDVDSNGNALIIVITDGSWGKRSYGKGYSSLSGSAVLVGYRTKKVIYVGVKNKYCQTCANAYAAMCPPNDHPCNINFEGASSGMETAIIVEGFKHCATLGARFPILIADGDASTYKELRELRLYKDPVIIIDKYECVNHLFKNFRKKYKAMTKNTKYSPKTRKHMTISKGMDICLGIRMATDHWRNSDVDQSEKLSSLEKDCMNAPYHYFGQHDKCASYFCKRVTTQESIELVNFLKTDKLFQGIVALCQDYFASNVKSLLANYDTNAAEGFNSLVAKFLGGKRINYSLAGSYKGRIGMATVHHNSEYHGGSEFHKAVFDNPLDSCKKLENRRKRKLKANAIALQKKPRKKPTYDKEESQVGYGEGSHRPDKSGRALELALQSELATLEENRKSRESILQETQDRESCAKWHEVRQNIISSFYFPKIINANNPKSYKKLTFEILYNPKEFAKTAERKHYSQHEEEALNVFRSIYNEYDMEKCGIFIDKELCFLGSTPLRLYGPESIVVAKCPLKGFNQSIDDAVDSKAVNFWKRTRGSKELSLNDKSVWYLEIQGELHVSDRKFAYLVVWLGLGEEKFKIEKIERDDEFWESRMKSKLTFFFNESMVKELADSRRDRKMELREYDKETNTFV